MTTGVAIIVAGVLVAFGGPAFAHEVTGIDVNCTDVTVHWSGFPEAGVSVHIAVQVEGVGSTATDVMVDHNSSETQLSIAALTNQLNGASGTVDVDVTWTFEGPQHVQDTAHVTCGTAPTTTSTVGSSGSTIAATTTTTAPAATTTTVPESTTTTSMGESASTSTTTTALIGGQQTTPTTTISVSPAEAVNGSGTVSATGATSGSLPFTGSNPWLIVFGFVLCAAGATLMVAPRVRARRS
jgi:hypothetical protein